MVMGFKKRQLYHTSYNVEMYSILSLLPNITTATGSRGAEHATISAIILSYSLYEEISQLK